MTNSYLNTVSRVIFQRWEVGWEVSLTIVIKDKFVLNIVALINLGAVLNCLQEGLVPTQFYEKTKQTLSRVNGKRLTINYKLSNAHICNQDICIKQTFILVRDPKEKALLGVPFLNSIYPIKVNDQGLRTTLLDKEILFEFTNPPDEKNINTLRDQVIKAKENQVNLLRQEINLVRIEEQLKVEKTQDAIEKFKNKIIGEICSNIPNAFWHRKQHEVELPYEPDFSGKNIPTKAKPI